MSLCGQMQLDKFYHYATSDFQPDKPVACPPCYKQGLRVAIHLATENSLEAFKAKLGAGAKDAIRGISDSDESIDMIGCLKTSVFTATSDSE